MMLGLGVVARGSSCLRHHVLVVEFHPESLQGKHVVLFVPRKLLHDLLSLLGVVVEQWAKILLLYHDDHVEEVV